MIVDNILLLCYYFDFIVFTTERFIVRAMELLYVTVESWILITQVIRMKVFILYTEEEKCSNIQNILKKSTCCN